MTLSPEEDVMQINLLPEFLPSRGYENIITVIDVFPQNAIAHLVSSPAAVNTAEFIFDIKSRHTYLVTLIIGDKGSIFLSNAIHEKAEVLNITNYHVTTKHLQIIQVLKRTQATTKRHLKCPRVDSTSIGRGIYH